MSYSNFISKKEVARILGISSSTVSRWTKDKHLPEPFSLGPNSTKWDKMKELKATRVPPGDRWSVVDGDDDKIYSSLTEVLNVIFMQTGISEFYMDAKKGEVHIEDGKAKPEPIKKYSLYGEEI